MASKSLTFDLFGRDVSASKTMRGVGDTAEGMGSKFKHAGLIVGAGLAAVGVAAVKFGMDSVKAYSEAAEQQNKLAYAFKQFPALADTNQKALQKLNSAIQAKTRFDDDDLAGAQSVLAQYKLTGAQIKEITPLLADYAQKTGKDLPSAATDLGKAMLGQGRGLKAIGVNFVDTKDAAQNYNEVIGILKDKVGGFAEQAGGTAAGKLAIFQNKFGDLQETIGEKLMPVLTGLVDYGNDHLMPFIDELANSKGIDDFFNTIEKHSKNGDLFGFLDASAWKNGADQWIEFVNGGNGSYDPAKTGGPLDPGPWANGFEQIRQTISLAITGVTPQWVTEFSSFLDTTRNGFLIWAASIGAGYVGLAQDINNNFFSKVPEWINGMLSSILPGWSQIRDAGTAALGAVGSALDAVVSRAQSAWSQISGAALVAASRVLAYFGALPGQIASYFGTLGGRIMGAIGDIGGRFYSVGSSIVQGMISGVTSWAGRAASAVANVAANMLVAAKAALGIHSPSRVFRDQVGAQIGAGIIEGVNSTRSGVNAAVAGLVSVPSSGSYGGGGGSNGLPSLAPMAAGAGEVHVHVQGTFLGTPTQLYNALRDGMKRGDIPRNAFSF